MPTSQEPGTARALTLPELAAACQRETARYRRAQPSDPSYCLEIFARALRRDGAAFADEPARELLVQIYSEHIRANISRRALRAASADDLVQQAWLRFWNAAGAGLSFPTLAAALTYLRCVTVSAVMEAKRAEWRQAREVALADLLAVEAASDGAADREALALGADEPDPQFSALQRARLRERCRELIADPLAYRVFSMRFDMAMPPREIASRLAQGGQQLRGRPPTPRAVSDLIEQCMGRLAADQEIRDLLQSD